MRMDQVRTGKLAEWSTGQCEVSLVNDKLDDVVYFGFAAFAFLSTLLPATHVELAFLHLSNHQVGALFTFYFLQSAGDEVVLEEGG